MKPIKFYNYIIIGLVSLNVIILAVFLFPKPRLIRQPSRGNFQTEVIKLFRFDRQQASNFKALTVEHKQKMEQINEQQRKLLLPFFGRLTNITASANKDSLLNRFEQLEREKIEVTYHHFEEIKQLLNKSQLIKFEEFMQNATEKILLGVKKKPSPPKDFN